MVRAHPPFRGRRFVGDTSNNIVHDQLSEQKLKCLIDEIETDYIRMFNNLDEAKQNGFHPCNHCLWTDK